MTSQTARDIAQRNVISHEKAPSNVNHPMAGLSFFALPNSRRQASRRF
jgi:hypothetical protein